MSFHHPAVSMVPLVAVVAGTATAEEDEVSVEEPLEIRVRTPDDAPAQSRPVAVTMRTPGADIELTAGFLFTEGIIGRRSDLRSLRSEEANVVVAEIAPQEPVDLSRLERQSFVSSSCGVCGKRSIAAVFTQRRHANRPGQPRFEARVIHSLPGALRAAQDTFNRTGGLHASALFTSSGHLLAQYEDVGRHNALDKLIGAEFLAGRLPLDDKLLLVSGRASFELIQKATMAGLPVLAAVGAPSSLAVSLAREAGLTLLGFVREGRFNVYTAAERLAETCSEPPPVAAADAAWHPAARLAAACTLAHS